MYRGSCNCQAIQYEVDHIDERDATQLFVQHGRRADEQVGSPRETLYRVIPGVDLLETDYALAGGVQIHRAS